jgi:hypothetical protein
MGTANLYWLVTDFFVFGIRFQDWMPIVVLLFMFFGFLAFLSERQGLHDQGARNRVVNHVILHTNKND